MDEVTVGLAALERMPLFAGLAREHLEDVLGVGRRVSYEAGQAIVERGDPGDAMYIVLGGAAEVDVGGRFHRLERGDFFGEMAVLAGRPREATVRAVEPLEALRIPADEFQAFLGGNPYRRVLIESGGGGQIVFTPSAKVRAAGMVDGAWVRPEGGADRGERVDQRDRRW